MDSAVLCPKCGSHAAWSLYFKCYICTNVACAWARRPNKGVETLNKKTAEESRIDSSTVSQLFEILRKVDGFIRDAKDRMELTSGLSSEKEVLKKRLEELQRLGDQVRQILERIALEELAAQAEKLSAEIRKQLEELLPAEYLKVA